MSSTNINELAGKAKKVLGERVFSRVRALLTSILTPISWSKNSGHFKSSIAKKAVSHTGEPIPWFTYPANDFLRTRDLGNDKILEFGGGQSTIYWSKRSKFILTFDDDVNWANMIRGSVDSNVEVLDVPTDKQEQVSFISSKLRQVDTKFDLIIVDSLHRPEMFRLAVSYIKDDGMILCDNAAEYDFYEVWQEFPDFSRIDFYGHAAGVLHPHCTTMHFKAGCKYIGPSNKIYCASYALREMP